MNTNLKIELHILQNFPPANLNRDDTNMPKDCDFGGFRRARVSSQCIKRAVRHSKSFNNIFNNQISYRTQYALKLLRKELVSNYNFTEDEVENLAKPVLQQIVDDFDKKDTDRSILLFYTNDKEIHTLARIISEEKEKLPTTNNEEEGKSKSKKSEKKDIYKEIADKFVNEHSDMIDSVDIALFGRMLTSAKNLSVNAACQVAHAISTHRVATDFDYFTAVDDIDNESEEEQGAAMIGTVGFNSACFYRYSVIDVNLLLKNLGYKKELSRDGVLGFIKGSLEAIPTGKQTSFAAHTPPAFAMVIARENGIPISLANAFEKPVSPSGEYNLSQVSIKKLIEHFNSVVTTYCVKNDLNKILTTEGSELLDSYKDCKVDNIDILLDSVRKYLDDKFEISVED